MNTFGAFANLFQMIVSFYGFIVIARFMLQLSGADFYNPLSQGVVKATNIPLQWIRKVIPSTARYDFASLIWLFVIHLLLFVILSLISMGTVAHFPAIVIVSFKEAVAALLNFWMFTIIIGVIASWVAMGQHNPALDLIDQLTRPILNPIQKVLPSLGGFDLSPLIAITGIIFIKNLFSL